MGASNFARANASKYFVVLTNNEIDTKVCNECNHIHRDWEYELSTLSECDNCKATELSNDTEVEEIDEYQIENQKQYTIDKLKENKLFKKWSGYEMDKSDMDRNYPATTFFEINKGKSFGDIEMEIQISLNLVGAYYEGATLDWSIEVLCDGYEIDEDSIKNELEYRSNMNSGMKAMQVKNIQNWIAKTKEEGIAMVEKAFEQSSEPYNLMATFSNGESIYQAV